MGLVISFGEFLEEWLFSQGHELSSGGRVTITTEDGVSCLAIENITADDSGKYVVSVENSLGADCQFASVAVEGKALNLLHKYLGTSVTLHVFLLILFNSFL